LPVHVSPMPHVGAQVGAAQTFWALQFIETQSLGIEQGLPFEQSGEQVGESHM